MQLAAMTVSADKEKGTVGEALNQQKKPFDESPMHWGDDGNDCPQ